jgi:low temperature requirement protein LtrA
MPNRPIIVFDVNETLLDLGTIRPTFDRIFDDPAAMRLWFAGLITYSQALTLAGVYVPFTDIGGAVLRMLATTRGIAISEADGAELTKSGGMLAIAAVAISLRQTMAGHGGTVSFAVGYVVLRLFLIALYVRARRHVTGAGRKLCDIYIAGYSSTTALWLVSIFIPSPYRYVLWGLAMAIDLIIPTRAWATLEQHSVVVSHLTERFGTFFIIVLGQSVIAVVAGVAGHEFSLASWIVAGICFVIALCLWWIYFDLADTSVVGRRALGLVFVYGHFPLLAGVAALGVGTKLAITASTHTGLSAGARWALAGGVGAFALSLAALHIGAEWTSLRDRTFLGRLGLAVLALTLAAIGGVIAPLAFAALIATAVLGQLLLEAFTSRPGAATIVEPPSIR